MPATMKKLIITLSAMMTVSAAGAQAQNNWDGLDGLLFPEFTEGTVYFWNGRNSKQMLNYDPYSQQMMFIQNGELMLIQNLTSINYMVIDDRIFVRYKGDVFFEEIRAGQGVFYANHRTVLKTGKSVTGYGDAGLHGTSAVSNLAMIPTRSGRGTDLMPIKNAEINMNELEIKPDFFIYVGGDFRSLKSPSDVAMLYGNKKEIAKFARKNKLNLTVMDDVSKLVEYAASLKMAAGDNNNMRTGPDSL